MQPRAFWKYWLWTGFFEVLLATASAWSQQPAPAPPAAPSPAADAKSYVEFGIENARKNDLKGAMAAFNQAISINPQYAPAYYNRGVAYALQNLTGAAIADYSRTVQLDPGAKEAYYQRGSMKGLMGDFDAAISDFSEVVKLDPKYANAYYGQGHARYFKGDFDGALGDLDQALTLDPNLPYSYFIRGLIRNAQGNRQDAASDFQKSAGLGFPYAFFWVWISEMEGGQRGLARQDLSDALSKPDMFKTEDWPSQIGNFLLEKISQDQLIAKAKAATDPETSAHLCQAWFYAGMHNRLSGDSKGAKDCFAQAIATGSKGSEEFVEANNELMALQKP